MAAVNASSRLRCQRIGCNATFTDEDNPEGSCVYHESPYFHDGMKEWSCCKQKSHDFSLFLDIPGCKAGKHTTEKPITSASPTTKKSSPIISSNKPKDVACLRCQQGFFCSDHGSQAITSKPISSVVKTSESPKPPKKRVGLNEPQTCRNSGCGKTFKEKDNHETACDYHPGPPIFHDRIKGWKCCDVHVKEFDEFMAIPPCTKGWHNADAV